jgi:hypothetical protein
MELFYPFDLGAQGGKLVFEALVATIQMVDALDQGFALR